MRLVKYAGGLAVCLLLAACGSTEKQIADIARDLKPTVYQERSFFGLLGGHRDEVVDGDTVEVEYWSNPATSFERNDDLLKYHAALLGRGRGAQAFVLSDINRWVTCGTTPTFGLYSRAQATYVDPENAGDKVFLVDAVIDRFSVEASHPPDDYDQRQRNMLAFNYSCRMGRLISPDQVKTYAEQQAEEAGEKAQ